MSHLGALITPFVDGELSPAQAAQARAHVAGCEGCAHAVQQERAARRRTQDSVRGMQASAELTARLLAMPAAPQPVAVDARRARRAPLVLGGSTALVGLFVLTLFVLGSPRPPETPGSMLAATSPAPGAAVTTTLTRPDVAAMIGSDWSVPSGVSITRLDVLDEGGVETLDATFQMPDGDVRVLERTGSLDVEALAAAGSAPRQIGGHVVYTVDGWHLLESGPCVVALQGETDDAAESVIAQLPAPQAPGFLERVADGWHVLVGG